MQNTLGILWEYIKNTLNPLAPACQGHQGCVFRVPFAFQQSSVMFSAISHLLLSCSQAHKRNWFCPGTRPTLDPPLHRKSINFQTCFQGSKIRKTTPKASKKTIKIDPRIHKNKFCGRKCFALLSMRKPGSRSLRRSNFDSEIEKKWTGNKSETKMNFPASMPKKLSKKCPEIDPESIKILLVLQSAPEVPKWFPATPKWRHQGPEMATARS